MNKKQQSKQAATLQLGIIYPKAAGIDVGSMSMMVSYPGANGIQTVEEYGAYSENLHTMANRLKIAGLPMCVWKLQVYTGWQYMRYWNSMVLM